MLMGLQYFMERVSCIDDGCDRARRYGWPDMLTNGLETARALGGFQPSQGASSQRKTLHEDGGEIDLALHAAHHPNTDNATILRCQIQIGLRQVSTRNIEDDVDVAAIARLAELLEQIPLPMIGHKVGTQRRHCLTPRLGAGR